MNFSIRAKSFPQAHIICSPCQSCNKENQEHQHKDQKSKHPICFLFNLRLPPTKTLELDMHLIIWKIEGLATDIWWLMCLLAACLSILLALLKKAMVVSCNLKYSGVNIPWYNLTMQNTCQGNVIEFHTLIYISITELFLKYIIFIYGKWNK